MYNTNAESFVVVSQGSSTYARVLGGDNLFAWMDMSGLNSFEGTFGRLLLGIEGAAAKAGVPTLQGDGRQTGRIALAATNVIHLTQTGNTQGTGAAALSGAALVICDQGGTAGGYGDFASYLFLGQSNALFADTITVGREGTVHTAVFEFNPAPLWTGPQQFFLRGQSSNRVSELIIADNTLSATTGNAATNGGLPSPGIDGPAEFTVNPPPGGNSTSDPTGVNVGSAGLFDVSAGTSDMMVDTLIVGKSYKSGGGGYADGVLNIGLGTLDVNTLVLAEISAASSHVPCAGALNVLDPAGVVVVNNQLALGPALRRRTFEVYLCHIDELRHRGSGFHRERREQLHRIGDSRHTERHPHSYLRERLHWHGCRAHRQHYAFRWDSDEPGRRGLRPGGGHQQPDGFGRNRYHQCDFAAVNFHSAEHKRFDSIAGPDHRV